MVLVPPKRKDVAKELMKVRSGNYMRMPGVHWVTACPKGQGTVDLGLS